MMKRLLAQIGITYFSVLAAAFYLPEAAVAVFGGIALVLTVVFFSVGKLRKTIYIPAMALAAVCACLFHLGYTLLAVQPLTERYAGEEHEVRAVLLDEPYKSYAKNYYRLETRSIDGEAVKCRVMLKTPEPIDAQPDDVLTFRSEINVMQNDYYRSKGYYLVSDSYGVVVDVQPAAEHSAYYYAIQMRTYMRGALDAYLPEDCAALCRAVLIGDKYALELSVRENFRYAGASYFIVVSGMHFAVLFLLLDRFLRLFHNRWLRLFIPIVFIILYMAVTGFQSSVMRSGIMILFLVFGSFFRRQTYALNHLGVAGIIMPCVFSPYIAGDIGLILSFYATMSILLWATSIAEKISMRNKQGEIYRFRSLDIKKRLHVKESLNERGSKNSTVDEKGIKPFLCKLVNRILELLSVSLAANILVFPISVFIFHGFSLATLVSSLLLYLPIYLILMGSLTICILFYVKPLAILLAWIVYGLCRYVLLVVEFLGSLPYAYIRVGDIYLFIWAAVTVLLGAAVLLYRNGYRYLRPAVLCSAVVLLGGWTAHEIMEARVPVLEVYACGDGICADISSGGRLHLLRLDANTAYLYDIMEDLSYRYGGAQTALCCQYDDLQKYRLYREDEFAISDYLLYDSEGYDLGGENVVNFSGDSLFFLDDDLTLRVAAAGDIAIPYITTGEKQILLIPDGCTLDDIPENMRQADVIILSHADGDFRQLRCDDLIISDAGDSALLTAEVMRECCQHVYMTDRGDVTYRLR